MAQLQLAKKQYQATKTNALEVLKLNPNNGTALMLIGKAYANSASNYGEDDFDHAPYSGLLSINSKKQNKWILL